MVEKYVITWEQYTKDIDALVEQLKHKHFNYVYGIPRGGLIPATILSHKLGIPLVTNFTLLLGKILVVDDLVETRTALNEVENHLKFLGRQYSTAVVYSKTKEQCTDYTGPFIDHTKWVTFPYEKSENADIDSISYYKSRRS